MRNSSVSPYPDFKCKEININCFPEFKCSKITATTTCVVSWRINSLKDFQVKILNRWGNVLYSSINEYVPWDAIYNGARVPTSDYYYVIELFSLNKVYTGTLTVRY